MIIFYLIFQSDINGIHPHADGSESKEFCHYISQKPEPAAFLPEKGKALRYREKRLLWIKNPV